MCAMRLDVMDESCYIGDVLNDEEKIEVLNAYVDLINLIDCLTDWRKIFDCNCRSLEKAIKKSNIIRVKSDLMSCLSTGVSLIAVIEHILKMDTSDSDLRENIISKQYDDSFSYRFMYFMRNFTQHSSIPIKYINDVYSFDVYNILNINYFSIKKDIKEDLKKTFDEVKNLGVPYLDLEPTILSYEKSIYSILNEAYCYIKSILKSNRDDAYTVINDNQQFVYSVYGTDSFCWICGDQLHALPIEDNPLNLCESEKKQIKENLKSITNNYEKVKQKYCAIEDI